MILQLTIEESKAADTASRQASHQIFRGIHDKVSNQCCLSLVKCLLMSANYNIPLCVLISVRWELYCFVCENDMILGHTVDTIRVSFFLDPNSSVF